MTKTVDKNGNLTPHMIGVILGRIRAEAEEKFIANGGTFVDGDHRRPLATDGMSAKADYAALVILMIDHLPPRPRAGWWQLIELGGMITRSGWAHYFDDAKTKRQRGLELHEQTHGTKAERDRLYQSWQNEIDRVSKLDPPVFYNSACKTIAKREKYDVSTIKNHTKNPRPRRPK